MDLRVRSTHQTAEPWIEERIVIKAQKGENVQVQNQGDADAKFETTTISSLGFRLRGPIELYSLLLQTTQILKFEEFFQQINKQKFRFYSSWIRFCIIMWQRIIFQQKKQNVKF